MRNNTPRRPRMLHPRGLLPNSISQTSYLILSSLLSSLAPTMFTCSDAQEGAAALS